MKIIIVINGVGGVGKDTFCNVIAKTYQTKNVSSIDPIKQIAAQTGWDKNDKSLRARKFLSDLKLAYISFNDLPNNYLCNEYHNFMNDNNEIMFVHIREPEEIEKFKQSIPTKAFTLLIKSTRTDDIIFGNVSDDEVEQYHYDFVFNNNAQLNDTSVEVQQFFDTVVLNLLEESNNGNQQSI